MTTTPVAVPAGTRVPDRTARRLLLAGLLDCAISDRDHALADRESERPDLQDLHGVGTEITETMRTITNMVLHRTYSIWPMMDTMSARDPLPMIARFNQEGLLPACANMVDIADWMSKSVDDGARVPFALADRDVLLEHVNDAALTFLTHRLPYGERLSQSMMRDEIAAIQSLISEAWMQYACATEGASRGDQARAVRMAVRAAGALLACAAHLVESTQPVD